MLYMLWFLIFFFYLLFGKSVRTPNSLNSDSSRIIRLIRVLKNEAIYPNSPPRWVVGGWLGGKAGNKAEEIKSTFMIHD